MTPEQDLRAKIPDLIGRFSPLERQRQRVLLRELKQAGHLSQINPFWQEYAHKLVEIDVGPYIWGIERCPLVLKRKVRRQALEQKLSALGGSLEIVPVADVYNKGEMVLFHLHTNDPDQALGILGKLGKFEVEPEVENLQEL